MNQAVLYCTPSGFSEDGGDKPLVAPDGRVLGLTGQAVADPGAQAQAEAEAEAPKK